jgi:hypothetical protein
MAEGRKIVVRFIMRWREGSNGSRRCIAKPLSHNSASPTCQLCRYNTWLGCIANW